MSIEIWGQGQLQFSPSFKAASSLLIYLLYPQFKKKTLEKLLLAKPKGKKARENKVRARDGMGLLRCW